MNQKEEEKNAGGMSYRTLPGIETTLITQFLDYGDKRSAIFKKYKKYYTASANKTISRLELAKIRVENSDIPAVECRVVMDRIFHGLDWLKGLKNQVNHATNIEELQELTPYKMWHAVKLIPLAAEGHTILTSIENMPESNNEPKKVKIHLKKAKIIFSDLLNLDEDSNFAAAEKSRLEAFEIIEMVQRMRNQSKSKSGEKWKL